MTTMQIDRAVVEQALEVINDTAYGAPVFRQEVRDTITALRAALAQQKDPTDPGNDVDVLREHVRHLERRVRQLHAQQAEPVQEPVHEHEDWCASVTQLLLCDPPRKAPCNCKHTAPPQRTMVPLTEKEIAAMAQKTWKLSFYYDAFSLLGTDNLVALIRAVERAHGIKE